MYKFKVQEAKRVRVILSTDAKCEADDQYAIVHALLTPKFDVKGIVVAQWGGQNRYPTVMEGKEEVEKIFDLMGTSGVPLYAGHDLPLESDTEVVDNEGVDFIINEALKEDDKPLFVLCQGSITDVGAALIKCPEIAGRFTCVWIGGGAYPNGGWEFNSTNDIIAANTVMRSSLELWQVPMSSYIQMQVSYAELQAKVMPCGKIGKYLFDQLVILGETAGWINGESWALGDSPAIGLAMNHNCGTFYTRKAPLFDQNANYIECDTNREIRVYDVIDKRFILEDFFAKLKINYPKEAK
ncbi:MAG: nucleoside hydrolase [Oscillospiraceae bacterium]|nr:nucleoside hydrolase [Oscillospiraceae bacterium]